MEPKQPTIWEIIIKTIVTHTSTYFIMGLLASSFFNYAELYAHTSLNLLMRQTNDPLVIAGTLFQPFRGILFGIIFYLVGNKIFHKKNGWLVLWSVLIVFGILGTFGPAPGSLEGMIFTILPLAVQLKSLPEVILQTLSLSIVLVYWVNHPEKKWLNWVMGVAFFFVLLFPLLGLLVTRH